VQVLLGRLGTGRWNPRALNPASLNDQAAALGPAYNIFAVGSTVAPAGPDFVRYRPAPYLRPFDLSAR
jgi:hypothetical protein